jgi:aspartate aminotransferase
MNDGTAGSGVKEKRRAAVTMRFGDGDFPGFSAYADRIQGSTILKIAGDVREMLAAGERVLNLTVGDFRPDQFPIPEVLREHIRAALDEGHTNYPPVTGVTELREAVRDLTRDDLGLEYPIESFLVAGGARPLLYSSFMALVDPGDKVVYPVPSWNNHHYVNLSSANGVPLAVVAAKNFHLDRSDLEPHLAEARLLVLNSPLNPTGTCTSAEALRGIGEAIVEENERRRVSGRRALFLAYDQVYNTLTFGDVEHHTPVGLVPELAPYTVIVDAVSKGLCGTGLRVGWAAGPPRLIKKMASMAGHFGAWAPRPEQVGTARFLADRDAVLAHRRDMIGRLEARLGRLDTGFRSMREDGLPVEHIAPQGAIYLSLRFPILGRTACGRRIETNEDLRTLLLAEAGFAVVPFEAFGHVGEPGWVRVSVGAVSVDEIDEGLARVRKVLETVE